uniref:Umc1300 n=1 Tax=Arundo donax TaxID=35708 RepID=A0A0A9HUY6_ARUDO
MLLLAGLLEGEFKNHAGPSQALTVASHQRDPFARLIDQRPHSLHWWPQLGLQQTKKSVIPSSPLAVACTRTREEELW